MSVSDVSWSYYMYLLLLKTFSKINFTLQYFIGQITKNSITIVFFLFPDLLRTLMQAKVASGAFSHSGSASVSTFPGMIPGLNHVTGIPHHTLANFHPFSNTISNSLHNPDGLSGLSRAIAPNVMAFMQEQERNVAESNNKRKQPDTQENPRKKKCQQNSAPRFPCDSCERTYASHGNLKRHKKYECGRPPQFTCPVCGCKFQHRHSMKIHVKGNHPAELSLDPNILTKNGDSNQTTNVSITEVPGVSPSGSPPLQIVDEDQSAPSFVFQRGSVMSDQNRLLLDRTSTDGIVPQTIATAEVAVASVSSDHDVNFVALQRARSQSSSTDKV